MQGAKPIRSVPLQAQAVAGCQPNLPVNNSEDSTLCLSTRGNLGVNNTERPSPACVLYSLTAASFGLTTKREVERVSGSVRPPVARQGPHWLTGYEGARSVGQSWAQTAAFL